MVSIVGSAVSPPRRMIDPLPNWRSICMTADSRARFLPFSGCKDGAGSLFSGAFAMGRSSRFESFMWSVSKSGNDLSRAICVGATPGSKRKLNICSPFIITRCVATRYSYLSERFDFTGDGNIV
jgi:hypothetical protein